MTRHYNPSIAERALRILNSKQGDYLSDEVSGPVATIEIKPVCRLVKRVNATTSGTTNTIFTTAADKDTYITAVYLALLKESTCDAADSSCSINVTIDGVSTTILSLPIASLIGQEGNASVILETPIKADRNTTVTLTQSTYTTGRFFRHAIIYGYTEETTRT